MSIANIPTEAGYVSLRFISAPTAISLPIAIYTVVATNRFRAKVRTVPTFSQSVHIDVDVSEAPSFDPHLHGNLGALVRLRDSKTLAELGGHTGIAQRLKTSLQTGIGQLPDLHTYDTLDLQSDLTSRQLALGYNVLPQKHSKSFWHFLWSACQDVTLAILILCAALSLGFGIKSDGFKEGWYDGVSIAFAVLLVIFSLPSAIAVSQSNSTSSIMKRKTSRFKSYNAGGGFLSRYLIWLLETLWSFVLETKSLLMGFS